jgi:hypothetical protein
MQTIITMRPVDGAATNATVPPAPKMTAAASCVGTIERST